LHRYPTHSVMFAHDAAARARQWRQGARPASVAEKPLGGHLVLNQADDCRKDRTGNSAACKLADERANVDGTAGLSECRNYCRQNLSANTAADRAGDCIAGRSQAQIF
jgi:hypothetical protein